MDTVVEEHNLSHELHREQIPLKEQQKCSFTVVFDFCIIPVEKNPLLVCILQYIYQLRKELRPPVPLKPMNCIALINSSFLIPGRVLVRMSYSEPKEGNKDPALS